MRVPQSPLRIVLTVPLAVLPALALAHPAAADGVQGGLVAGLLHPLGGPDHLAAMLAVGLWTALAARRRGADLLFAPLTFLALLLTGALLTQSGIAVPAAEPVIALSLLALGLLVASRARWPLPAVLPAVALFGLFHGAAHGGELAGPAALAGLVLGSCLLLAVGVVGGLTVRRRGSWLPRVAGVAVVLTGAALLMELAR